MARSCPGPVTQKVGGGRWQQLQSLRNGNHPKTMEFLGPPVPEAEWQVQTAGASIYNKFDDKSSDNNNKDSNTKAKEHSIEFELEPLETCLDEKADTGGSSSKSSVSGFAKSKFEEVEAMRHRIVAKQAAAEAEKQRLGGVQPQFVSTTANPVAGNADEARGRRFKRVEAIRKRVVVKELLNKLQQSDNG